MKRKTNLFYLSGDESNFITFSNYGEALTGNFLATDWKLFPSRFLCIYIKYLDVENTEQFKIRKRNFIEYLTRSYENKMAVLRDYYIEKNVSVENNIYPLNYLLETLLRISISDTDDSISSLDYDDIIENYNNGNFKLTFIGDITEQDYNGTYTDIINIINSSDKPRGEIQFNNISEKKYIECNDDVLHGWTLNELGAVITPIFDSITDNHYYTSSIISGLKTDDHKNSVNENIKFNILIPLYDLVNISLNTNSTIIDENTNIISLTDNDVDGVKNEPLGIWIADSPIELKRNNETGYAPSWSLMLGTQFKPFPYSQKIPNEISNDSTKEAFATYSQVLLRQNTLLNKFEAVLNKLNDMERKINLLESKINTVGTSYTSDRLRIEMMNFEKYQQDNFNTFKNEMYSYVTNWKGYIG